MMVNIQGHKNDTFKQGNQLKTNEYINPYK